MFWIWYRRRETRVCLDGTPKWEGQIDPSPVGVIDLGAYRSSRTLTGTGARPPLPLPPSPLYSSLSLVRPFPLHPLPATTNG